MSVLWIAQRELRAVFSTTVGWLVLTAFLLITGVFWVFAVDDYMLQTTSMVYNPYGAQHARVTDNLLLPFFGNCTVVVLMVAPALSMRTFSEELRQHTLELLLTSPVSTGQIVLGKFLGAVGVLGVLLAGTLHCPIGLSLWASPDLGVIVGGYLGLLLFGSAILAMGVWFSVHTSNQIVASVLTFGAALSLYVLGFGEASPDSLSNQLSLSSHVVELIQGNLRASDLVYFAGVIGVCLFATQQRLEAFRWR